MAATFYEKRLAVKTESSQWFPARKRFNLYQRLNGPKMASQGVDELTAEIDRLKRDKPEGWKDLTARYADDPEGLKAMIDRAEKQ